MDYFAGARVAQKFSAENLRADSNLKLIVRTGADNILVSAYKSCIVKNFERHS
jgi:hypothetical protein